MKLKRLTPLLSFWLLLLPACMPIPQVHLPPSIPAVTYRTEPSSISTEYIHLPGFAEPTTPKEFNQTMYLRYYLPADKAQTILVLVSGLYGGAMSFDILARQLVAAIPKLEVWAVDRRANLLEDRSIMQTALKQHDPMLAYDYYIKDGASENSFQPLTPDQLGFMRNWSLEVHLYDLHEIVKRAEASAKTVILGGHSLGGSMVGFYSAFVFPDGAGYQHLEGLFLIDGVLGRTGGFGLEGEKTVLGELKLVPSLADLKAGRGEVYSSLRSPKIFARREATALMARFDPDGLAPGSMASFPITKLAAIGIPDDDDYSVSTVFSSSMGEAVGASFSGNLPAALLSSIGIYSKSVKGVAAGYDYVRWERSNSSLEVVDPAALTKSWSSVATNRSEWYFPLRLALSVEQTDMQLENIPGFIATHQVPTATLAVGAERGLVNTLESFSAYSNLRAGSAFSMYILPNFTHLDILFAEKNPLVGIFQIWLERQP
jgi:pimeloyl-ACP methyl ester carboxylesterase